MKVIVFYKRKTEKYLVLHFLKTMQRWDQWEIRILRVSGTRDMEDTMVTWFLLLKHRVTLNPWTVCALKFQYCRHWWPLFVPCPILEDFTHVRTLKSRHHAGPPQNTCPAGITRFWHVSIMLYGMEPIWKCPFKGIASVYWVLVSTICCTVIIYMSSYSSFRSASWCFTGSWSSERLSNLVGYIQDRTKPNTWLMNTYKAG